MAEAIVVTRFRIASLTGKAFVARAFAVSGAVTMVIAILRAHLDGACSSVPFFFTLAFRRERTVERAQDAFTMAIAIERALLVCTPLTEPAFCT